MKSEKNRESDRIAQGSPNSLGSRGLTSADTMPNELKSDSDTFSQATIMMVDDEATTMEVMQAFLEEAGYQRFVLLEDSSRVVDVEQRAVEQGLEIVREAEVEEPVPGVHARLARERADFLADKFPVLGPVHLHI